MIVKFVFIKRETQLGVYPVRSIRSKYISR